LKSIKLPHVLSPQCHPQGVYQNKVQHANLGTDRSYWQHKNIKFYFKMREIDSHKFTVL